MIAQSLDIIQKNLMVLRVSLSMFPSLCAGASLNNKCSKSNLLAYTLRTQVIAHVTCVGLKGPV